MQRQPLSLLLVLTLTLISCNPCDNVDCISDNYIARFRIVSKNEGKDLVFGPAAIYNPSEIKLYSLKGTDTTFFEYTPTKFSDNADSILYVKFYPEISTPVYLKLNSLDTDTLTITYKTFKTKCCGTITEIIKFRYNNSIDIPSDRGPQVIRK
jgi:hypothetical protein